MADQSIDIETLAGRVGTALSVRGLVVATAESCTGGWIAKCLTDHAGSSGWFGYGYVTYSNTAKVDMLGIAPQLIQEFGAVSPEVVEQMAIQAQQRSDADLALAVSGIAGPDGGTADKPVGTVWLAWCGLGGSVTSRCELFAGDREAIRRQAVALALSGLLTRLAM